MFDGWSYDLDITATLELPELLPGGGEQDVRIVEAPLEAPPRGEFAGRCCFRSEAPGRALLAWKDLVTVRVEEGQRIVFNATDRVETPWLRQCLLGPALGLLLAQRGLLTFHASAVAIDGRAVVFLGPKGAGKSTTAALLCGRGHRLLADDIVAVDMEVPGGPRILPGFPQVKLWPDSAQAIDMQPKAVHLLHSKSSKQIWDLRGRFWSKPLPLRQIVVLTLEKTSDIERLAPKRALTALIQHLYVPRLIGADGMHADDFRGCAHLVETVPVCQKQRWRCWRSIEVP